MTRICQIDSDFPHSRNTVMFRNEPFFTDRNRNGLFRDIFGNVITDVSGFIIRRF